VGHPEQVAGRFGNLFDIDRTGDVLAAMADEYTDSGHAKTSLTTYSGSRIQDSKGKLYQHEIAVSYLLNSE
jgi:hypothetical protein